ncbi:MAG: hypothetical protein K0A98_07755 [Trueperaceae bacterium]|nr:hypothetical protein [Trueperaceae bacterium]
MPIEDDLVQRTLAELSAALVRLERRPEPAAVAAARGLLDRAYRRHLGVAGEVVRRLPSDQLLAVISTTGRVDGERAFLTAALIEVDAAMPGGEGASPPAGGDTAPAPSAGEATAVSSADGAARAPLLKLRALDLYTEAGVARVGVADLPERVRRLRAALLEHLLPEASYGRLLRYFVHEGRFAAAEDLLFEWLEEHGATPTLRAAGEGLYDDLEAESDERLLAGELPRDELAEGRAMFRRSCGG